MSRTLRSRSHRFLLAAVGIGVVMVGSLLLQLGPATKSNAESTELQLAVGERGDDEGSSRGTQRTTGAVDLTQTPTSQLGLVARSIELSMLTTTTTVPPTTTTTVPPTTTTTAKPTTTARPKPPVQKQVVETKAPDVSGDDVWIRLARCESGMRNDQGAPYYGYFQFSAQTWRGVGGSGLPNDHPYEVQLELAKKLQARSGWGQWPHCSRVALRG